MDAQVPCRMLHLGLRVTIAVVVGIVLLMSVIMIAAGGDGEWKGKWLDIGDEESGDYICMKPSTPCPADWTTFRDKCWHAGRRARNFATAQAKCVSKGAHLATIEDAAEDTYAFGLCSKDVDYCFFGLKGYGDTQKEANWKWLDGSTSTYRNWWKDDDPNLGNEPTGEGEHSISWMTQKLQDAIHAGIFFGLIIFVVWILLVITCCSMNSTFVFCGLKQKNSCCLITAASLDGAIGGVLMLFGLGAVARGDIRGFLSNCIIGVLFIFGSVLGCVQCGPAKNVQENSYHGAPAVIGQAVGAAPVPVVGQVVVGAAVQVEPKES